MLVGFGVDNGLQLTLEGQRALSQAEQVFTIGLPDVLKDALKSWRIPATALDERFQDGDDYAAAYLDVADFLLRQAALEPPVAVLLPGNPMFQSTLSRFLVHTARERDLPLQVFPSVSIIDALISDIGLDVTSGGLQVFDARSVLKKAPGLNPRVPLIVLGLGTFPPTLESEQDPLTTLSTHLQQFYPGAHPATLVTRSTGRGDFSHSTVQLQRLVELSPHLTATSALFLDVVRGSTH